MDFFDEKKNIIIFILILIIILLCIISLVFNSLIYRNTINKKVERNIIENGKIFKSSDVKLESDSNEVYVDIKGAIVNPGVYKVDSNSIINDVISVAGGLKKNGSTKNINLSKKVKDEMVIYIYTKFELNNVSSIKDECICNDSVISNCLDNNYSLIVTNEQQEDSVIINDGKVSINTGSLEDLMTLNGIGESKAKAIIEYREKNGLFKTIEEIMNVSGIGDAAYQKIKDTIKL